MSVKKLNKILFKLTLTPVVTIQNRTVKPSQILKYKIFIILKYT